MSDTSSLASAVDIISALGTVALAEQLGHSSPSTVGSWKSRNAIPAAHWSDIVAAAAALGRPDITILVLADAYPKRHSRGLQLPSGGRAVTTEVAA